MHRICLTWLETILNNPAYFFSSSWVRDITNFGPLSRPFRKWLITFSAWSRTWLANHPSVRNLMLHRWHLFFSCCFRWVRYFLQVSDVSIFTPISSCSWKIKTIVKIMFHSHKSITELVISASEYGSIGSKGQSHLHLPQVSKPLLIFHHGQSSSYFLTFWWFWWLLVH